MQGTCNLLVYTTTSRDVTPRHWRFVCFKDIFNFVQDGKYNFSKFLVFFMVDVKKVFFMVDVKKQVFFMVDVKKERKHVS